jgi:hypothetical protein
MRELISVGPPPSRRAVRTPGATVLLAGLLAMPFSGLPWLFLVSTTVAMADAPLRPPSVIVRCSTNGLYCARAEPEADRIVVYRKDASQVPLWTVKGWARAFDVADSGTHLVTCYGGLSLLPLDYRRDWTMLSFYDRGRLVRRVSLGELVPDLSKLRRTASHYEWGRCEGFDGAGKYSVETVDRGALRFDVTTGELVR